MNTSIIVEPYTPIPNRLTVPVDSLDETVASYVKKHAVRWIYKRRVEYSSEAARTDEDQQQNTRKRQRLHPEIWYKEYTCHMAGEKRIRDQDTGKNGKPKEIQKKSKKQGCLAKLKAIVYKADPTNVVLITETEQNHIIGSLEDLQYLPLSDDAKALIETRLREGYRKRETRFANQQSNFRAPSSLIVHRDQMVHAEDVQNIYKKIQEAAYIRHPNVQESIKIWLNEELQEMRFYTYIDASFSTTFSFGFVSPWQARLLVVSTCICLDATHCVANVENGILYTIVVRHPLTGTGCPVANFYTNDHSMVPSGTFYCSFETLLA
ncbi:hypothetical protein [Parasitella parasitica]|uniref:MULE transposase domain-containing protein n=1 Tax=Parasitella parasitica TaxID=35722 RepID=A0A0B7NK24_9FUNG|nr:hypothetical protein [Parasitella parasitica]